MSGEDTNSQRQTNVVSYITVFPTLGGCKMPRNCNLYQRFGFFVEKWTDFEKTSYICFHELGTLSFSLNSSTITKSSLASEVSEDQSISSCLILCVRLPTRTIRPAKFFNSIWQFILNKVVIPLVYVCM